MKRAEFMITPWFRLTFCVAMVALIWLGVLPQMRLWRTISNHIELMEKREVKAGAMYYTDLENLPVRPEWVAEEVQLWPE